MKENILKKIQNFWILILLWVSFFIFFIFAPKVNAYIFENVGRPLEVNTEIPEISNKDDYKYSVDGMKLYEKKNDIYNIQGWTFSTEDNENSAHSYVTELLVFNASRNYLFETRPSARKEVVNHFSYLELDIINPGFSALINKNTLFRGKYCVGVILTNVVDNSALFFITNKALSVSPNTIELLREYNPVCYDYIQ